MTKKMKLPDWDALNIKWNEYEEKIEVLENMLMDALLALEAYAKAGEEK